MPISEAKRKADAKWSKKAYDQITIRQRKGTKERWKQAADRMGISLAQLIKLSVEKYIGGDN